MRRRGTLLQPIISMVVIGLAIFGLLNRQWLIDQFTVWQFKPSAEVAAISQSAQLTESGRFYFYASQPKLSDRDEFNATCVNHHTEAVTLGCYVNQQIYVYNIDDKRLDGIKEVTAAHEMLHAAYERLPGAKREEIVSLLRAQAQSITDADFKKRLAVYKNEPQTVQDNELHSILATERERLTPELEAYYKQYFVDRQAVVALFRQYETVFTDLKNTQDRLISEINALIDQINRDTGSYNAESSALTADITAFNARSEREGGFASIDEFNAARAELVTRQQALAVKYQAIQAAHDTYERKKRELDALQLQAESIHRSLDSTAQPVPAV
ncbi:MAG TPA: hypothetical protein VD907_02555 [Verrucomicrobiae bacterium]|nr:hypothetical protein [Verrucomicrobiae bacterium]